MHANPPRRSAVARDQGAPGLGRERGRKRACTVLLGLILPLLVSVAASAQTPGCAPQTSNYPCVYVLDNETDSVGVVNSTTNAVMTQGGQIPPPPSPYGALYAVAVTPDNGLARFAYTDPATGAYFLTAIDTLTNTLSNITPIPLTAQPYQMAISPDGTQAWVMETTSAGGVVVNSIEVVNLKNNAVSYQISPGANERLLSVAFSPDGAYAYVASDCLDPSSALHPCVSKYVANITSAQFVSDISVSGGIPDTDAAIAVTSDGLYIIRSVLQRTGGVVQGLGLAFLNTATSAEKDAYTGRTAFGSPTGIAIAPSGKVFLAPVQIPTSPLPDIFVFDLNTLSYSRTIAAGTNPNSLTITADGNTVYVVSDTVYAIDTGTGALKGTIAAASFPAGIAAMPSLEPSIVTQPADQTIEYGQTATLSVTASGSPTLTYQWYQGPSGNTNTPVPNATNSSFTTPALTTTTNYWVQVSNIVANGAADSRTAIVTVKPLTPPSILQQPGSTSVTGGNPAQLSVTAAGTPPLSFQWYTGNSGDTSNPVPGATNSSLVVTPATTTSYWVRVTNTAGQVDSNTATVTVNFPPTCTLALRGTETSTFVSQYDVLAAATCTDPQNKATTVTVSWADGTMPSSGSGPQYAPTHTYSTPAQTCNGGPSQPCLYDIHVSATDQLGLSVDVRYPTEVITASVVPPVFSGQTSTFTVYLASPSLHPPEQVKFVCTTATKQDGTPVQASSIGISCSSLPPVVTLTNVPIPVTLQVSTTGLAAAQIRQPPGGLFIATGLPGCLALIYVFRRRRTWVCVLFLGLSLLLENCGGGFKLPPTSTSNSVTPPGNYQLTIVDEPVDPNENGFVQISLIVPIEVSQTQ